MLPLLLSRVLIHHGPWTDHRWYYYSTGDMAPAAVNMHPALPSLTANTYGGSQQRVDGQQVAGTHTITRKIVLAPRGHADADATALNSGVRIGETLPLRHMDDVVAERIHRRHLRRPAARARFHRQFKQFLASRPNPRATSCLGVLCRVSIHICCSDKDTHVTRVADGTSHTRAKLSRSCTIAFA